MPQSSHPQRVKATDVAFARVTAPDLDAMEEFLTKLGMVRSARTADKLFMRGATEDHHLHVTELGEARNVGLAFQTPDEEDLHRMAKAPGASPVHEIDEPGGGKRVILHEPNGYAIELVHGIASLPATPLADLKTNSATKGIERRGRGPWGPDGPPHIMRFGHAVMLTPRFEETLAWFADILGMKVSDEGVMNGHVMSAFLRFDHDDDYVDHHSILVNRAPHVGWHHFSYEVGNWSEVFAGAAHMAKDERFKLWMPPTRHGVGGQVGAYFADPWGRLYEFWADGDRVNAEHEPRQWTLQDMMEGPNWGDPRPGFFEICSP